QSTRHELYATKGDELHIPRRIEAGAQEQNARAQVQRRAWRRVCDQLSFEILELSNFRLCPELIGDLIDEPANDPNVYTLEVGAQCLSALRWRHPSSPNPKRESWLCRRIGLVPHSRRKGRTVSAPQQWSQPAE